MSRTVYWSLVSNTVPRIRKGRAGEQGSTQEPMLYHLTEELNHVQQFMWKNVLITWNNSLFLKNNRPFSRLWNVSYDSHTHLESHNYVDSVPSGHVFLFFLWTSVYHFSVVSKMYGWWFWWWGAVCVRVRKPKSNCLWQDRKFTRSYNQPWARGQGVRGWGGVGGGGNFHAWLDLRAQFLRSASEAFSYTAFSLRLCMRVLGSSGLQSLCTRSMCFLPQRPHRRFIASLDSEWIKCPSLK